MTFNKIICPLDFSTTSYLGLKHAIVLSSPNLTELCIIHIEKSSSMNSNQSAVLAYAPTLPFPQEAQRCADAIANLCSALEDRVPKSLRSRPLLKRGEAAEEILRTAREENADLIVLTARGSGQQGESGVPEVGSLGSVAQAILSSATCPVVVISTPQPELTCSNGSSH